WWRASVSPPLSRYGSGVDQSSLVVPRIVNHPRSCHPLMGSLPDNDFETKRRISQMLSLKRILLSTTLLLIALTAVACGSYTSTGSGNSSGTTPTPTTAPTSAPPVIKTTTATVKGTSQTILTNAQGMTLYYFTAD